MCTSVIKYTSFVGLSAYMLCVYIMSDDKKPWHKSNGVRFFVNPKWAEDIKPPAFIFNDDCVFTQPIPILKIEVGDIIVRLKGKIEYDTTYSIAG